ncbi:hypothetical protein [Streptomyces albus]|uniref:hypothetical protein n=1 Tax=Streptomyces albus TaxID=1888 RepID=UPI0033D8ADEC
MGISLPTACQSNTRAGHARGPRVHIEAATDTDDRTHEIRLGVFRSNTRTHHKKQKPTPDQIREAAGIGLLA